MSSVFGILHAGKSAILAQQKGIEVTGQNITNVNTPGYTRQRLNLTTAIPIPSSAGSMGTGVEAKGIERVYDSFLGAQINQEEQDLGRWEARKNALDMTEIVFNEAAGKGLNEVMGEFWNAWQDLANDPSGQVQRVMLLGKSEDLTYQFQQVHNALSSNSSSLDAQVAGAVDDINFNAAKIADYNQKIVEVEASGDHANDYRDARDMALKELSSLIDTTTFEQKDGSITIKLGDGRNLVDGSRSSKLATLVNDAGHKDVCWASLPTRSINDSISSGKLKGLMETRDVIIPGYMSSLEDLTEAIKTQVNTLHAGGFGLDGSTGKNFFTGSLAGGDFSVNSSIAEDSDRIAAAQTVDGLPGDNSNALAIADLQTTTVSIGDADTTFDDYYDAIVSHVGADVQQADVRFESQSEMATYLDNYRESISGVSLDEEMVNLIQYQRAYESAAKLISVADELLSTLINTL